MYIAIACYPVCDVINFETNLNFLIKSFSYMTKNLEQNMKYLKNGKNQPYCQRLREYRFYVYIGRGVNIGCDRCFYMTDVFTLCF